MTTTADDRPTGDEMLARVARRASGRRAAGCALYLGMAPGVGKTYRMLEEGHRRLERGHGRRRRLRRGPRPAADRRRCSTGSRSCPGVRVEYRGVAVEEMDTDAIIARHPAVALIDELAHTNVPGSPREKRWQDVELIRDAGIDVDQHLQRPAPRVGRRRRRDDRRRAGQRAPARRGRRGRRRGRAGRHEPARAPPADAPRQRLSARAGPGRPRPLLHRAEPDGPARAVAALRHPGGRRAARGASSASRAWARLRPVSERVLVVVDERPISRRALRRGAMLATALGRRPDRRRDRDPGRRAAARSTRPATSRSTSTTPPTSAPRSSGTRPATSSPGWSSWPERSGSPTSCWAGRCGGASPAGSRPTSPSRCCTRCRRSRSISWAPGPIQPAVRVPSDRPDVRQAAAKRSRAVSASIAPMASELVAAGDGALRTWRMRPCPPRRKSSTSVPSRSSACARTPEGPNRS